MNNIFNHTVSLISAVKAAVIDTREDFTKVEATYSHWAVRILKDANHKLLRLGAFRGIFPIHASFKTANIPLGCRRITFIGIIDECGHKHSLREKNYLVGKVEEEVCIDKCPECNQGKDICENLTITEEKSNGHQLTDSTGTQTYINTSTKYFENGGYYLVKKQWVLNIALNLVQEIITKDFIVEFDMLKCGCIAPTEDNIAKVKEHCYDCYCACFTPCREDSYDIGGYRVLEDIIQFDLSIPYDKIYIEWEGMLPKKNGVYHIPEVAFEMIVSGIKTKRSWNNRSIPLTERQMDKADFVEKYNDCQRIVGRMGIGVILDSFNKIPKVDGGGGGNSTAGGLSTHYVALPAASRALPAAQTAPAPVPLPVPLPNPIEFLVSGSSPIISNATTGLFPTFIGFNVDFLRNKFNETTIPSESSYYSWDKTTGILTVSPKAEPGEIFKVKLG